MLERRKSPSMSMGFNCLPAMLMASCLFFMTSPEVSSSSPSILPQLTIVDPLLLTPSNRHHHHHRNVRHRNPQHRKLRHTCQFPESLQTYAVEGRLIPPIDLEDFGDINLDKSETSDVIGRGNPSTQAAPVSEGSVDDTQPQLGDPSSDDGVEERHEHHKPSESDDIIISTGQHKNKTRHHPKGNLRFNFENEQNARRRRDVKGQIHRISIRDWRGEVKKHFQSLGKNLTIEKNLIVEQKGGEILKYRCSFDLSGEGSVEGDFGEGRQHIYLVEKEEFQEGQETSSRKFYSCLVIIVRSPEIIQFAFSSDSSEEPSVELCGPPFILDNWLYVDKLGMVKAKQPCPLKGGFEMKMFNSVGREALCDAYVRETRYESGCSEADPSHFSFIFRWARCVPSAVPMKPLQDLTCVASWHQSSFLYIILRTPVHTRDTDNVAHGSSRNAIPSFFLPKRHRGHALYDDKVRKSLSASGSERFETYMFRLPRTDLINEAALSHGKNSKFQAILYSNMVTVPGFEFKSATFTDGVYVRMSTNKDERSFVCEDDYEACGSVSPPCGALFQVTCPKTCGLCSGSLSFNDSRKTEHPEEVPSFCNFPSFIKGDWLEVSNHLDLKTEVDDSRSESLHVSDEFIERSSGTESHLLRCIQWGATNHSSSSSSSSSSFPSSFALPHHQIMAVGPHSKGCTPRYTCIKVFPLSDLSIAVAFSKDITWPLMIPSQLENSPGALIVGCETAQKTTMDFYPKNNFRLFTRREGSQMTKTPSDSETHFELSDSDKLSTSEKLLNFLSNDDSLKVTFSDGFKCSGALRSSGGDGRLKFHLNDCVHAHENSSSHGNQVDAELHRRIVRQKYFRSSLSPGHVQLFKSQELKFLDAIVLQQLGENVRSLVAKIRYGRSDDEVVSGKNILLLTSIRSSSRELLVPHCWLIRDVRLDSLRDERPRSDLPFSEFIFLFSGRGCLNAMEDYMLSSDPDHLRYFRFSPPSFRPTRKDRLKFPEEDFASRSLAVVQIKSSHVTTRKTTSAPLPNAEVKSEFADSGTTSSEFVLPRFKEVEEVPSEAEVGREARSSSAEEFVVRFVAGLLLALVDFISLMASLF